MRVSRTRHSHYCHRMNSMQRTVICEGVECLSLSPGAACFVFLENNFPTVLISHEGASLAFL